MAVSLYQHQIDAIRKMKNGCILVGDVGTGKSRTAIAYYFMKVCDGDLCVNGEGKFHKMRKPRDLYIITTAKKRDSHEWCDDLSPFALVEGENTVQCGVNIVIDSWNNIKKYKDVVGAFFIFDEQRVVGSGAWVKAFLNIARKNQWILLSATPGDTWTDYIPVFVANGYFKNRSEFCREHCVYSRFAKYPKIERYTDTGKLQKYRGDILVHMYYEKETIPHHEYIQCDWDKELYKTVWRYRWDPYDDEPIAEMGKLCYLLRKVVNSDESRIEEVRKIVTDRQRVIIFYNYTYELEMLRELCEELGVQTGEWNGEVHTGVPSGQSWVYLVQYLAGSEGWNCTSYRTTKQAEGRIDRLTSPYKHLYYYHLKSTSPIDIAIGRALKMKRNFNEKSFTGRI